MLLPDEPIPAAPPPTKRTSAAPRPTTGMVADPQARRILPGLRHGHYGGGDGASGSHWPAARGGYTPC